MLMGAPSPGAAGGLIISQASSPSSPPQGVGLDGSSLGRQLGALQIGSRGNMHQGQAPPAGSISPPQQPSSTARSLQGLTSAAMNQSPSQPSVMSSARQPLPQGRQPQLDPNILSRMVTVQGAPGAGSAAGVMPFRVATMQDFRRSRNSLNTVHESLQPPRPRAAQNQAFAMNRPSVQPGRPMASENPLLKMMEARMAANATGATTSTATASAQPTLPTIAQSPSPPPVAMSTENKAALQASINKWAGKASGQPTVASQGVSADKAMAMGLSTGRAPLSPKQIDLLKELTASQNVGTDAPSGQNAMAGLQTPLMDSLPPTQMPVRNNAHPGLTRCAVSLAEVDRLRRENQSIQLQQQLALQQRVLQQQRNEQAQLTERNIAVNALLSMKSNEGQNMAAANIGGHAVTQDMLNQIQANALNRIKKMSSGNLRQVQVVATSGLKPSRSSSSFRKRRSEPDDDDDTICSKGSLSSHTHSITSSASSHKIHRSLSHSSARGALAGSMENLRIASIKSHAHLLNGGARNQSFSSGFGSVRTNSYAGGLNMQNQSFGSGSHASSQASQAALRRSSSSNGWIQSMLADQHSAGKAAETFEQVLQQGSSTNFAAPSPEKSVSPVLEEAKVDSPKPIQVQAEEYSAPRTERSSSESSETVIISAVPDRIKYKNAEAETKPIDVVKKALSDRGDKCDVRPTMDMADDFFTKVTDMYDQDVVTAIRASDVVALRKFHNEGTTLQCGNRFGETLTHLACRRSHRDVVSFLVHEVGVSLRVRDDYGRTPLHDACWRAEPDLELLDLLLDRAPELLMLSDKRGHTPLDYARREHWAVLVPFLLERAAKFRPVPV